MVLKLLKPIEQTPSWLTTSTKQPSVVIIEKPKGSFLERSMEERRKTEAIQRRHVLTPEEMAHGRASLGKGGSVAKSEAKEEAFLLKYNIPLDVMEQKKKGIDISSEKYKTVRVLKHLGLPIPEKTKKLPIKESYIRTTTSEKKIQITDPIFGITKYGKPPKISSLFGTPQKTTTKVEPKKIIQPTLKLFKPAEKVPTKAEIAKQNRNIERMRQEDIKRKTILAEKQRKNDLRSLFGGMFVEPTKQPIYKPKAKPIEKKKIIKKRKPVEKKMKIIKKYYRKYPKHCVRKQRR